MLCKATNNQIGQEKADVPKKNWQSSKRYETPIKQCYNFAKEKRKAIIYRSLSKYEN